MITTWPGTDSSSMRVLQACCRKGLGNFEGVCPLKIEKLGVGEGVPTSTVQAGVTESILSSLFSYCWLQSLASGALLFQLCMGILSCLLPPACGRCCLLLPAYSSTSMHSFLGTMESHFLLEHSGKCVSGAFIGGSETLWLRSHQVARHSPEILLLAFVPSPYSCKIAFPDMHTPACLPSYFFSCTPWRQVQACVSQRHCPLDTQAWASQRKRSLKGSFGGVRGHNHIIPEGTAGPPDPACACRGLSYICFPSA